MTAQEMYIEVTSSLQAIGASRTRAYERPEIEWVLNKVIDDFPKTCLRKKEGTESMYEIERDDAIRTLLVEAVQPLGYTSMGFAGIALGQAYLPHDFAYLLELGSEANCTPLLPSSLAANTYQTIGIPIPGVSAGVNIGGTQFYYHDLSIVINGVTVYSRGSGYKQNPAYQVIHEIEDNSPIKVNNSYLTVTLPKPNPTVDNVFTIVYDGATLTSTSISTSVVSEAAGEANTRVKVKNVRDSNYYNRMTTPYYKPSTSEILAYIDGQFVRVDTPVNLIVNNILISYIRKPRRISLSLETSSDIAVEYHNEICNRAVTYIRERIGDPKFQTGLIESKQSN